MLLTMVLAVPQLASAQSSYAISGHVLSVQPGQATFVVQDFRSSISGSAWSVHVNVATETRRPDGGAVRGPQGAFRLLRVGDLVDVQGFVIGGNRLLATNIFVRAVLGVGNGRRDDDDDDDDDRRSITVAGIITHVDDRGQGVLQLREQSGYGGSGRTWTVRLYPLTRVEGSVQARGRGAQVGRGARGALRLLRVGDFVEVRGRWEGRHIRAQRIRLHTQVGAPAPFPTPFPTPYPVPNPYPSPYPTPVPAQTIILSPTEGSVVTGSEFTVFGQTIPGAQVRVQVTGRVGVFNVPVANGTVTANQAGQFSFLVRPASRVPGATYTITVTASGQGYSTPPVTVTVRQQ
jgi:hypothetical protein